ncbi:MAG: hypothetical protein IPL40_13000 [Proteobacteria bacterium]|nr:hypothetical protein [Pseudomonadota bacterium]
MAPLPSGEDSPPAATSAPAPPASASAQLLPGWWHERREIFRHEAAYLTPRQPERAALMWLEAVGAAPAGLDATAAVVTDLEQALTLGATNSGLLGRARRLLMQQGDYRRALAVGQRELSGGGESEVRAALLFELAALERYALGRPQRALALLRQALRLQPTHVPALLRVVALGRELALDEDTVGALKQLANCLNEPGARAQLLYAAGTLLETRLQQSEAAGSAYRRAVDVDPRHAPTLLALAQLHERNGEWAGLARALERLADVVRDSSLRARLWQQGGALHLDLTGDSDAARRLLARAARLMPDDAALLQRLSEAYELKGQGRELLETLRLLLVHTPDRQGRAALLTRIGDFLHEQQRDAEGAIVAYRQALSEVPGYLPALQSLATLHRQRGDFEPLVAIANPETEGTLPAEARAVRYVELAEVLDQELGRSDEAIAAYRRALELLPGLHVAFVGLAALLRRVERHDALIELLGQQAAASHDPATRTHLLLQQARLQTDAQRNPGAAIGTLAAIPEDDGGRLVALERIEIYARAGRDHELLPLLLEQAEATRDAAEGEGWRLLAARRLERLDESEQALALYREVLTRNPGSLAAVHGIGRLLHRRGSWQELVALHHHELNQQPTRPDAPLLLCRIGRLLAERLGEHAAAIDAYARALAHDPTYTPALVALERLARSEQRWGELVTVLEQYAAARHDAASAAAALCRAAEVAGWQLGDSARAAQLFAAALQRHPDAPSSAYWGLLRLQLRHGWWSEAAELLLSLLERAGSEEERGLWALQLARLRELQLEQPPDAALYAQAAVAFPGALHEEQARVQARLGAAALAEWLATEVAGIADPYLAAAYLLEAAHHDELQAESGAGAAAALVLVRQAHERRPTDPAVIWCLERNLVRLERWAEVAKLREHEAQLELDRAGRVQGLAHAASAHVLAAAPADAERLARECLNLDARWLPALLLLAALAEQRDDGAALAELLDRAAEACVDPANRRSFSLHAAWLWEERLGDSARALNSLAASLADDPGDVQVFAEAERLLTQRGDDDELSRRYQRAIRACGDGERKAELLARHARLLSAHPAADSANRQRLDRALTELGSLLELRPDDTETLSALAAIQSRQHYWSDAAATLAQLAACSSDPTLRRRAWIEQARLWLKELHEPERARAVLEEAEHVFPDDLELVQLRLELASTLGEWDAARALLEQLVERGSDETRRWAKLRLAQIVRIGLQDQALGERGEQDSVREAAHHEDALQALRALYPATEERRRLLTLAERLVDESEPHEAWLLRRLIARIALEDLNEPGRALPQLQAALQPLEGGAQNFTAAEGAELHLLMAQALEQQGEREAAAQQYRHVLDGDPTQGAALHGLVRNAASEIAAAAAALLVLLEAATIEEQALLASFSAAEARPRIVAAEPPQPERRMDALQELLKTLVPALEEVFGAAGAAPELAPNHPVTLAVLQLATSLGIGPVRVALVAEAGANPGIGHPLPLRLDRALSAQLESPAFRFWVGRALVRGAGGGAVALQLDDDRIAEIFAALQGSRGLSPRAAQLRQVIGHLLPRKTRRHLAQLATEAADPQMWSRYRRRLERWADRVALVLSRDPGAALGALAASQGLLPAALNGQTELAALMRFAVSEDYARLFRSMWT